ncbi:hypothetical protein AYO44_16885 [Planctomycetaceae bacterium SCGC AG-212-F19]|nr:hypothetical protein AYO44_16885 [Planctomycetaceae bacterium SCGC AG-212-F19]
MDRPCLRPGLAAARDPADSRYVLLWDQLRVSDRHERLTLAELEWVKLFNGKRTLHDIQIAAMGGLSQQLPSLDLFVNLVRRLEEALFLDGPAFRARLDGPVREPSCIGCYEGEPDRLRRQLERLFTGTGGPGRPAATKPDGRLRAALIPHIDYHRGGVSFAWGFKEVAEQTDAALFVIIGTSHYSAHRYTLTRKNFKTPLGVVPTDQQYIDKLVASYGDGLFDDELAHLPEHSIELEVVFLQYLYAGQRAIRIVPLLVGPFEDCVMDSATPTAQRDIGRMIAALRQVEAQTPEPICYIISGDLAHIGPKFGDEGPVHETQLNHSRRQDEALIRQAEAVDMAGYFNVIAAEQDQRRICGLPPTYTVLEAVRPGKGKLLHYDQYVHPQGFESVSFASVAFYR